MTARLLQLTAMLQTSWFQSCFRSQWRIRLPCDAAFHQNSLTTCFFTLGTYYCLRLICPVSVSFYPSHSGIVFTWLIR